MSNAYALLVPPVFNDKYSLMVECLSQDNGYWFLNDIWDIRDSIFEKLNIAVNPQYSKKLDFSIFKNEKLKNEAKYYVSNLIKNEDVKAGTILCYYKKPLELLARYAESRKGLESFAVVLAFDGQAEIFLRKTGIFEEKKRKRYQGVWDGLFSFIRDFYDNRDETEKDVWYAANIPGVKRSAAEISGQNLRISFTEVPVYYREMVKRFIRRLISKRSWSYCVGMSVYIKQFFKMFYEHGYTDGFFEKLTRGDIEKYFLWVIDYHKNHNATYRSKSVSFVRYFIDYIQLAEYPLSPLKDVNRLIYDDDLLKRERAADTFGKVKYIPAPVINQLDASVNDIEPKEFIPVYILLRESGWRGTDILNLRYDNCLDYQWHSGEGRYVGYLCGEITKTGIPLLKIPIRDEAALMVKELADTAATMSTVQNNPERYLFNVYKGKKTGSPLSKVKFTSAIKALIEKKGIRDAAGMLYHFKTHSMRHTRAMEYAGQGMPIGIIQQLLGHCSLQMTLHYAKVSENALYEKWKETEGLGLFHLDIAPSYKADAGSGGINYEKVRNNLDAVKVPFGTCFKPSKVSCKQQSKHCLECSNFCSTKEDAAEYETEIKRITELIKISADLGRSGWVEKNHEYLNELKAILKRIQTEGAVHKNGHLREEQ
ncbi:MAG: tyrosine-type recombinase/integrase [Defluviitaleaceae bacterium]|nr:tyrosine-type recombinase/integrase [Defluviitaleaceae bacterium]